MSLMMMMTMNGMASALALALVPQLPAWLGIPVWALFTLGFAGVVFAVFYLIDNMRL